MKYLKLLIVFLILVGIKANAQDYFPKNEEYNGNYYAIKSEPIKDDFGNQGKFITYNSKEVGGNKSLVLSICEKCMPAIYTYSDKVSKKLKKPVFRYEASRKMLIQYDKETIFITTSPKNGKNTVDYYSKNKAKADAMTKSKADELWLGLFSNK